MLSRDNLPVYHQPPSVYLLNRVKGLEDQHTKKQRQFGYPKYYQRDSSRSDTEHLRIDRFGDAPRYAKE